ncbi:VWA domain-containing protein [Paenibacillus gorillae]|uniref:VWA domain-containing protein n=1 Tax=Paenibacillus gorillae TaxID=1243662 RepID=UPI0004B53A81|nr:VWA domain-containing protein [Paenibacillus gorillae]
MFISAVYTVWRHRKAISFALLAAMLILMSACSSDNNASDSAGRNKGADSPTAYKGEESSSTRKEAFDDAAASEPKPERDRSEERRRGSNPNDVQVQAGQLTAGEWDDLAAWGPFGNLLNSREGDENRNYWRFRAFDRLEVEVTASGRAVADATVRLKGQQRTEWTAKTNAAGKAYVFAGLFDGGRSESRKRMEDKKAAGNNRAVDSYANNDGLYEVEVSHGNLSKKMKNIRLSEQGSLKVSLDGEPEKSNNLDIMFVIDSTGSMQDELDYLAAELKDVVGRVGQEHANQLAIRISTNFYRDIHDDYVVKPYPFTNNIDKAIGQIASQKAKGGGDYPEAVEQALRDAVREHDWRDEARARLMFLVLDAPPHHEQQIMDELHELIGEAALQGIRIIPVVSSGTDVQTEYLMRFMAVSTGGTYLFLTDDSGIGGEHLEPAAGEYEVKLLNDLLVETINRYVQ